jgi:hypothetical protein
MSTEIIKLSISIADRLVKNADFMSMPEASSLQIRTSSCPGCPSRWRQSARLAVPTVMEQMVVADPARLYNIIAGVYGKHEVNYRLPGASRTVFNKKGIIDVRSINKT